MRNHLGIEIQCEQIGQGKRAEKIKIRIRDQVVRKCDTCGKKFIHDRKPYEERNRNRCASCVAKVDGIYRNKVAYSRIEIR